MQCLKNDHQICYNSDVIKCWRLTSPGTHIRWSPDTNHLFVKLYILKYVLSLLRDDTPTWYKIILITGEHTRFNQSYDLFHILDYVQNAGYSAWYTHGDQCVRGDGWLSDESTRLKWWWLVVFRLTSRWHPCKVYWGDVTHRNIHTSEFCWDKVKAWTDKWTYLMDLVRYQNKSCVGYGLHIGNYLGHCWQTYLSIRSSQSAHCMDNENVNRQRDVLNSCMPAMIEARYAGTSTTGTLYELYLNLQMTPSQTTNPMTYMIIYRCGRLLKGMFCACGVCWQRATM